MSTSAIRDYAAPTAVPEPSRPAPLRIVETDRLPSKHSAWPFVVIALFLLVVAIAVPLVVNTHMAQTAYAIRDQRIELAELNAEIATMETQLLELSSPQLLDSKARALGLVPAGKPGTVSLLDGSVVGGEPAR